MTKGREYQRCYESKYPERYKALYTRRNALRKADGSLRRWHLKRKYGITVEQWNDQLEKQNGQCAICDREYDSQTAKWHVDHDHVGGKFRGILCHLCNRIVLPTVEHYQPLLAKARRYLLMNQ